MSKIMKMKKLNLWYKTQVPFWHKALVFVSVLILTVALSGIGGYSAVAGASLITALLFLAHFALTNYSLLPVLAVWAANLLVLPFAAYTFISSAPADNAAITISVATASLILASFLWTFIAYRYSSGKLWITLATIFVFQTIMTLAVSVAGLWQWTTVVALVSGGIGFGLRQIIIKTWRKRRLVRINGSSSNAGYQELPPLDLSSREKALQEVGGTQGFTVLDSGDENNPALVLSKRGIFLLFFYHTEERVDFAGRKAPAYKKMPLSPFFASLIKKATTILSSSPKVYTLVVLDDPAIRQNGFKVDVMSLENRLEGSIIVSHYSGITRTINQLPVMPLNESELSKVVAYVKATK